MEIDSSISPMPASRADRSSVAVEIFARMLMRDRLRIFLRLRHTKVSRHPAFVPRCFNDMDGRHKPGLQELSGSRLPRHPRCVSSEPAIAQEPAMTEFDPAAHRMVPEQRWFEDFVLGERFVIPSRTMTSAVFAAFQTASGDTHPVHYDVEYLPRPRHAEPACPRLSRRLIHTAPGSGLFPYLVEESLVGFLEQSSRFLKPVFADDTIYPALEVTELVPGRSTGVVSLRSTVFNQRRELVMDGVQKFLLRRRPAAP